MTIHSSRRERNRAQALVEFALIIPTFLFLVLGIVDFGRVVWANTSLAAAAREGARFAITHGGAETDLCPVGPMGPYSQTVSASASCPYPAPKKDSIVNAVLNAATAGGSGLTVTVCYGSGCSGNTDAAFTGSSDSTTGTNAPGQPVTVGVSGSVNLIVPSLLGMSSFKVSGNSTMVVNH
jgi:hypothetical protein